MTTQEIIKAAELRIKELQTYSILEEREVIYKEVFPNTENFLIGFLKN